MRRGDTSGAGLSFTSSSDIFNKILKPLFHAIYFGGMAAAAVLALRGIGDKLIYVAVPCVVVLFLVGFMTKGYRAVAGTKVQLAGYVYTLIGVMGALHATDITDKDALWGSIGAALITSILGWPLGRELIGMEDRRKKGPVRGDFAGRYDQIDDQLTRVVETMSLLVNALSTLVNDVQQAGRNVGGLGYSTSVLAEKMQDAVTAGGLVSEKTALLANQATTTHEQSAQLADNMRSAAASSKIVSENAAKAAVVFEKAEELVRATDSLVAKLMEERK